MNYYVSSDGLTWQTCATAGIVRPVLKLVANGCDTLAFSIPGDMLASTAWTYMAKIYLAIGTPSGGLTGTTTGVLPGCTTRFIGTITTIPRQGQGISENIAIVAAGGGWWLDQITYCHQWYFWNTTLNSQYTQNLPRVILGQDNAGNQRNSDAEIIAAVNWAIGQGAPITLGTVDALAPLPFSEHTNISVGDAIKQALRLQPDACYWFTYNTGVPVFRCRTAALLPAVNIPIDGVTPASIAMTPRYDLQLPGITIFYEISTNYNGGVYRSLVVDAQGTTTDPRAVAALYDLQGPTFNVQKQDITARSYPTINAAFVQGLVPWLATMSSVTLNPTKVNGVSSSTPSYPRYMLPGDGTIASWMQTMTSPVHSAQDVWTFNVTFIDANNNQITKDINVTLLSTDASTQTYMLTTCTNAGDNPPITGASGVAAKLYASWSRLAWDGQLTLVEQDCTFWAVPGLTVNITGGLSAWSSMAAVVQEVTIDLNDGRSDIKTGTSGRLSADSLVALWRGLHFYRYPTHLAARLSPNTPASVAPGTAAAPATVITDGEHGQIAALYVNGLPVGVLNPASAVQGMGANSVGVEAASSDAWVAGGTNGLAVWIETRQRYFNTGNKTWYAYARLFTYDALGKLYSVSAETRFTIDTPVSD